MRTDGKQTAPVSVIVPVYNMEKYLERCVASLLAQTLLAQEIILVDDGSTDTSGVLCDRYAAEHAHIRVIHKKNGGLSSARNAGIDAASGAYLLFVDSDDVLHREAIHTLANMAAEYHVPVAVASFSRFSDTEPFDPAASVDGMPVSLRTGQASAREIYGKDGMTYVIAAGKLFAKELFATVRFPEGRINEDEGTVYRLYAQCDRVAFTPAALYGYYQNSHSITTDATYLQNSDIDRILSDAITFYAEKGWTDCEAAAKRALLSRLINRTRAVLQGEQTRKEQYEAADAIWKRYRTWYPVCRAMVPGRGFWLFYHSWRMYFKLLKLKNGSAA